jgi:hypothetical protein
MVPSDPGQDLVQDDSPFGALQFTMDEVQSVLLELDVSKSAGFDGILPLILKNCAFVFERPLSLLFNRSLLVETFRRDIDIQERQQEQQRSYIICVAILFAIPKRIELLVYRIMYKDLKNLISVNQHGFMKNRSTVTMEYA